MHSYMHASMCAYIHVCICMLMWDAHVQACIHECICTCIMCSMHVCIHTHMKAEMNVYM